MTTTDKNQAVRAAVETLSEAKQSLYTQATQIVHSDWVLAKALYSAIDAIDEQIKTIYAMEVVDTTLADLVDAELAADLN